MTSTPLAEAASQFTLEDVVAHGQRQGRTPEQIATAVKRWRDGAREFGEAKLKESDPLKWFRGNAKLDSRIRDELDGVKVIAATEMIASTIRDEASRSEFVRQYQEFNGDPSKFAEGSGARSLAETLHGLDRSDAFNLPDASDRVAPLATEAGVMLGDFETQARPGNGGLDILIRLDDKEEGSKRKSITIPEVTDDDVATARSKAEDEAKMFRQVERTTKRTLEDDLTDEPIQQGYSLGYQADLKNRKGVGERDIETARIEAEAAEARVNSLADPERGRLVLLRERVEDQVKSDKDLKKIAGDVALGEDFWRGVQQTHLGARMAIADAKGDEEEKTKLRGLIGELGQIYPGSTNLQFRGGAGAFASDVSAVMGGMLPTMMVGQPAGIMNMVAGRALTGGLSRSAAISPISLSAYGNAYATMLNEADSLDQQGRVEEAEQRRRDARTYAMLSAAVETGSEFIFKEEMFGMTGKGFLRKVGTGAAQNTAEEFVASIGNAELNREFRDVLTPVSQIAYESALGTVVGGLMQVPGGVVEVFLPKAEPAPQATPPPSSPPPSGAGSTPPPSSPPPSGAGSTPPPSSPPPSGAGSTPPPSSPPPPGTRDPAPLVWPPPGSPTPPSNDTVYKVGGRLFTLSETGWTEQSTGAPVDPQAEPSIVFQLDEARRKLEAGETPVPQEVTLNPGETPTIFTIDGQRSFMPAPDGRGWLEVFPQTGEASRPVNFASEGEIGVAILRRLQAKIAEKQAAASPPANEAAQSPANESEISSTKGGVATVTSDLPDHVNAKSLPVFIAKDWTELTADELPPLNRELEGYGQWRRTIAAMLLPGGTKIQHEAIAMELANEIASENSAMGVDSWQYNILAGRVAGQLLTGAKPEIIERAKSRALSDELAQWESGRKFDKEPISVALVESQGMNVPEGYVQDGDIYVYRPIQSPAPANESETSRTESPSNFTPEVDDRPADGVVSSGKPKGAKARFRWRILSRADLEAMVVRDIEEAQTRQRKGNVASDEQRERMATGLDPDLVMESPVSSMGAPAVFQGKVLAGNGRADGIAEAYRRGLAGDYEARIREFAEERGLDVPDEPILIREIIDFAQGDARSFVVESNPKRGGMLAESVSEQALLDSETIGDDVLANLTFTADGNLTAGSLAAVATRLEEANRGITRTLSGQFDRAEAGRRVMAAFLSRLVSRAGRDASDVASILETDGGKRAVSAIAQAAPRLSKLDDDLSLATPIVESLIEFKSGLSAVSKGEFANMADWLENRTNELLASSLDPVSREVLSEMAGSVSSGAAMREFIDAYLEEAEVEQKERDNANSTGDIFGNERTNRTAEDIFRKLGRIAGPQASVGTGVGAADARETGRETEGRPARSASEVGPEAEGQLLPESELPFNLSGEEIRTAEPVIPEDTRTDAEKDGDSGQERLFDDRITPLAPATQQEPSGKNTGAIPRTSRATVNALNGIGVSVHFTTSLEIADLSESHGGRIDYKQEKGRRRSGVFSTRSGSPRIYILTDRTSDARKTLHHEARHAANWIGQQANPEAHAAAVSALQQSPDLLAAAAKKYPGFNTLSPERQLSEVLSMMADGKLSVASAPSAVMRFIEAVVSALRGSVLIRDVPEINGYYADLSALLDSEPAPAKKTGVTEADAILEDLLRRFPEKQPRQPAPRDDAAQERISETQSEVRKYFGGDVPSGVRVVWEPGAVWDANFNRDTGTIELNAALLRPGEVGFKIDHEVGHVLFQDAEFAAAFDALWNALPKLQRDRISRKVGKSVEKGYYSEGDAFEETRVRALEAIRRMAVGDHADAGVKRAWRKFLAALARAWKRITGHEPVDPERLAAAMIEIGVARMRSGTGGGEGVALSTIDFEGFKAWALDGIEPDGFTQEDMGRLWVAADVEGNVNILFGNFADADEYFRTNSGRGEFLWDVTESYERMVGGIPLRNPDGPITPEDAANRYYPVDPAPGETPTEAGNLPRVSPTGQPVTSALLSDMGLRYGLGFQSDATPLRKLPDPNQPHRKGGRIFSISDNGNVISDGPDVIFASTSVSHLRSQPEFNQAKNRGDDEAANQLVKRLVKPSVIADIRNSLDPDRPVLIIPVIAQEGTSLNMLPLAMAEQLGNDLDAEVWTQLYKTSSDHNTDAPANERSRTVHTWVGEIPAKGPQVVLVDDTYTSGQTLVSMAAHIGYPPSAVVTISSGRYGKRWKADPTQIAAFLDKAGISEEDFYEIYGITVQKALTGAQIHQYRLNGRAGRSGLLERFPARASAGGTGKNEGEASQGSASRQSVKGKEIHSLSDGIQREQAAAAQSLANLESTFRVSFFAGDFDGSMAAIKAAEFPAIEAFVKKHVRLAKAGNLDAAGILEWVKHINANTRPETVDAEIEELLRAKRARFPRRRSSGMRDILDRFFTAAEFERAFAQYVAAGDFQKAYEAVRDSDDNVTIPTLKKWMKAVRAGDPAAKKNLEWISAIFNGTVPPGVTQQPTSGPAPSSGTATPPPQQQAPPPPPPPPPPPTAPKTPPPRPQGVEKLNIPALVFLARKMGTTPLVRKFRARGSFRPSNKRGEPQESPLIKVNEFLGKEDWQGAARTLAHEIGHFIDYIVNAVPYADIVKRLIPLEAIRDQFIEDIFGQGTKYSEARKYMMDEAIALSKIMRGDFADNDAYRKSAVELYADFMSAVMIDPDLAFDTAPLMSHAWFAHLDQKPDALAAWNLVQDLLKGDALHEAIRKDRVVDQRAAMAAVRDRADRRSLIHQGWKKIRNGFAGALWSRYLPAAAKGATKSGRWEFTKRWWDAVTNPQEGDFLARMEGAEIEASQRGSVLRVKMQRDVYDPLLRHGIDTVQLDEYLTFFQIVNEDTATRQYLEENPDEFREFLLWLDDVAGLGRASEIEGASDAGLDLIGASMVGTIQLHEKFETVYAMAQSSDAPDIAGRGLFAFDIARYQWNQDGHTPETAQKGIDFLRRELGDERFGVLRDAARAFHQNLVGIVREANQVGLFGERIWNEKIEPNLGNYVPRMVLDYFTGEMSASIKQRRGSVKATLPKYLAGEGQAMVLLHKIAKQKQMLFILEQAKDAGWANEIQPINIPQGKNVEAVSNKLLKEERKGLRGYFVKGKWKWLVFDDADVVRWMDTVVPTDLKFIYDIAKANEGFWRLSVTVLNASFALYNNWVRMAITLPMDYGPRAVAHTLRQIPEAVNWAKASLGLAAPSDRVLELVERGVLPAFGQYTAGDMLLSHDDLIDQISSGLVGIDALRRGTRVFGPFEKVLNLPGIHQTVQFLGLFTGSAEALPKLAIESLLSKRGVPQWERDRLARMEGIPNTGLSAGKFGTYAGLFSLFYRVWVQGTRRLMTLPFNPRTRGAWWTGNILGLGAIKMFYAAAAAGFIDAMMGGDDEEKQVDWQEAYTRVSPYKIRMTDAFFLGWALPDGSYEAPWGHSSIPANWKPIMWRLPFTESGRVMAPLATVWSWNMWDSPLNTRSRSDAGRQARDVFFNSAVPSLNPIFENAYYATSLFDPRSPYNPYSGKDVVPKDQWDAGIPSRAWGITKHLLEETPLKNLAPAVRNGIKNESDLPPWARAVMSIPGSSAAISFDSSQLAADYMDRIEDRDSVNRKARLLRGAKTKAAVSLRSRLSRIPAESRTPAEQEKIEILNEWYRTAYMGNSLYPGLYRELQAHAAGMEEVDEKGAREALEETAVEVLREIGGLGR